MTDQVLISQEYFDEVCLENAELFDLDPDQAVQETIQQLKAPCCTHLSCTFPTSPQGLEERAKRKEFVSALEHFSENDLSKSIGVVSSLMKENSESFGALLVMNHGFEKIAAAIEAKLDENEPVEDEILAICQLLLDILGLNQKLLATNYQKSIQAKTWIKAFAYAVSRMEATSTGSPDVSLSILLCQLGYRSCRQCELNKIDWMKNFESAGGSISTVDLCSRSIDVVIQSGASGNGGVFTASLCRLISVLCTFDDLTSDSSSAHANVQRFAPLLPMIYKLRDLFPLEPAVILCMRSLAIQDTVVQALVGLGAMDSTRTALSESIAQENPDMAVACLGLFRNMCANDEIKGRLCRGKASIVTDMLQAMAFWPKVAQLQEHGCGCMGACALRNAKNAQFLIQQQAHVSVISAMQQHPDRASLQRQGALALRNLVSRSPEFKETLLQADAPKVLLAAAQRHLSCQDEVYAALRDMGVSANLLHVDETGNLKGREMFGGGNNANFRQVYD